MIWGVILLLLLILSFGGVLLVGAPYLPTLKPQVEAALILADLKPGQQLLELGCGDGKVMIAAAKQGIKVTGYELNPILALIAWARTVRYRKTAKVIWGDFWRWPWPEADAVFVFLLPKYMDKLNKKIEQDCKKPVKLVSFAFTVPGRKYDADRDHVYLYEYK